MQQRLFSFKYGLFGPCCREVPFKTADTRVAFHDSSHENSYGVNKRMAPIPKCADIFELKCNRVKIHGMFREVRVTPFVDVGIPGPDVAWAKLGLEVRTRFEKASDIRSS